MLSKSKISFIKSLHLKKHRREQGLFIIEGLKSFLEFSQSNYVIDSLYYTAAVAKDLPKIKANINLFELSETELQKISTLKSPQHLLALVKIPTKSALTSAQIKGKFSLVLDNVQDPGNLGTIIRIADWYGIENVICSTDTVDLYNPKTVQSTMGSLARVNIWQVNLFDFFSSNQLPVFGALLNGKSIYELQWPKEGLILLGNEGHGLSDELCNFIDHRVTIPRFGMAESLNVAISGAIFCNELMRNKQATKK